MPTSSTTFRGILIYMNFRPMGMQELSNNLRNNSWQPWICAHLTMGWAFIFDYFFPSAIEG